MLLPPQAVFYDQDRFVQPLLHEDTKRKFGAYFVLVGAETSRHHSSLDPRRRKRRNPDVFEYARFTFFILNPVQNWLGRRICTEVGQRPNMRVALHVGFGLQEQKP